MTADGLRSFQPENRSEPRGKGRYSSEPEYQGKRPIFGPLLNIALLCFVLALPFLAMLISIDIDFGGRWMCDPRPVGGLGTVYDRDGISVCQFQIAQVLFFWLAIAVTVSPLPVLGFVVRGKIRRRREPMREAGAGKWSFLSGTVVSGGILAALTTAAILVFLFGGYVLANFLMTGLAANKWCLCAETDIATTVQTKDPETTPVCCTIDLGEALNSLVLYPLLALILTALATYIYWKSRHASVERETR